MLKHAYAQAIVISRLTESFEIEKNFIFALVLFSSVESTHFGMI